MKRIFIFLFFVLFFSGALFGQDGSLDTSFDTDGKVTTDISSGDDFGYDAAVQSDGKIVVVGEANSDFAVVRYNADGSLDTSFDTDGIVTTDISGTDCAYGVAIQSDGKIVVAGIAGLDVAVVRYNTDGSLDTSFDTDGIVTTDISGDYDFAHDVTIQSNGKIVVTGYMTNISNEDIFVARYKTDGSLDQSFNGVGIVTTDFGSSKDDVAYAVAVHSDGDIVVAGYTSGGSVDSIAVVRYDSLGALDNSFGSGGLVSTLVGSTCRAQGLAIQSDGKIVITGYADNLSRDFVLVRYKTDGSLDTSFDTDGIVTTDFNNENNTSYDILIQSDDKIVVAGKVCSGSDYYFGVAKYNSDGSLDTSFDTDGKVSIDVGSGSYEEARAIKIQSDDKIVVAGAAKGSSDYDFGAARLNNTVSTVPVEITTFNAELTGGQNVLIDWQTATEVNNYGFEVQRSATGVRSYDWETVGFVEGAGNSNSPKSYSFTDNVTASGRYSYRLKQIDFDGAFKYSEIVEINVGTPEKFNLFQNYPNPFNPITTISYSVPSVVVSPKAGKQSIVNVVLTIYNAVGQKVTTLVNKEQAPGNYTVQFDARDLPSGIYYYSLNVNNEYYYAVKKMILLK